MFKVKYKYYYTTKNNISGMSKKYYRLLFMLHDVVNNTMHH